MGLSLYGNSLPTPCWTVPGWALNVIKYSYHENVCESSTFLLCTATFTTDVYGNVPNTSKKPLQIIHNRALRALQFKNRYQPINELHTNFSILKVSDMVHYKQSKIIHFLLTGAKGLPNIMKKLIVPTKKVHQHQTKQRKLYMLTDHVEIFANAHYNVTHLNTSILQHPSCKYIKSGNSR